MGGSRSATRPIHRERRGDLHHQAQALLLAVLHQGEIRRGLPTRSPSASRVRTFFGGSGTTAENHRIEGRGFAHFCPGSKDRTILFESDRCRVERENTTLMNQFHETAVERWRRRRGLPRRPEGVRLRHGRILDTGARQQRISAGEMPDFLPETETRESNGLSPRCRPLRGSTGRDHRPVERKMMINGLNSGGSMADFEGATTPTWDHHERPHHLVDIPA